MIPELGHFILILALCLSMVQVLIPLLGIIQKKERYLQVARPLSLGVGFFMTLALLMLIMSFLQDDFSVSYVTQHSNAGLPIAYKISALWAGHEGSLLLWALILSFWNMATSLSSRALPVTLSARMLIILGAILVGILLFLIFTSNPFLRLLPDYPIDGQDLNPLLQDMGLIIHPPLLYLGYVGLTVPFAFALSALWLGKLEKDWLAWLKPFVLTAWGLLTIGIALGSWWAYYELGWGGWWFWDPVENASFMPWLVGTALVHSLIISHKRSQFFGWTLLLAILAFGFCLLGAFLVRSGIVASVHAFAQDPKRGQMILQFLFLVLGGSFLLYAVRVRKFSRAQTFSWISRETLIILNTTLLLAAAATILLGTLYPIFYEMIMHRTIAVGPSYFNITFIPFMVCVLCAIPLGPFMKWGENNPLQILGKLKWSMLLSVLVGLTVPWLIMKTTSIWVVIGVSLGCWVIFGSLQRVKEKTAGVGLKGFSLGGWGMVLGHVGMGVAVLGIVCVSNYDIEQEVRVSKQNPSPIKIRDYSFELQAIKSIEGNHYIGHQAHFEIRKDGVKIGDLYPEKRLFVIPGVTLSEADILPGLFRDLSITLGDKLPNDEFSARIYYKPLVRWIWLGAIMIALGALLAACNRKQKAPR